MKNGKSLKEAIRHSWLGWKFCLPTVLVIAFVAVWPLAKTVYFSLTNATMANLDEPKWIGFENYQYLVSDPYWWNSVVNTLVFVVASISIETILGLIIALFLHASFRGRGFLRTAVLVPWAIPTVVCAKMWAWMFNDIYGVVNSVLLSLGLINQPVAWLANDTLAMGAVIAVDVWKTTPFMALLLLAGLQSIPNSLYEMSVVEGIGPLQRFFFITLPLLTPALVVAVIFRSLDALRVFDLPYLLTSNARSTAVMSVYARQELVNFQEIGYGSAASILIFSIVAIVILLFIAGTQRNMRSTV